MAGILHALDQRRLIDSNGIADGGSIAFYTTGTLTPATIYSDAALTTPRANPVVVAAGAAVPDIYLDDAVTYRRIITYPDGSTDDADPYSAPWATRAELENIAGADIALDLTTSSTTGVVTKGGTRFIHDYNSGVVVGGIVGWNLGVGVGALNFTNTGQANTAIGFEAMTNLVAGGLNTAVGARALHESTDITACTAVGMHALQYNTTGGYNNAFGCKALAQNTTGSFNTAVGQSCMLYSSVGSDNCGVGQDTLTQNAGDYNCGFGNRALTSNTTGDSNCAYGGLALYSSQTTSENNAFGHQSLYRSTTGTQLCAFGAYSLNYNTTGSYNVAFGNNALLLNTTGSYNVSVGYQSLQSNTTGANNIGIGSTALYSNTTANGSVAVGDTALFSSTGAGMTAIGNAAGYAAAGNQRSTVDTNCTWIGALASRDGSVATATPITNSTAIGYDAKASKSNQVVIGSASVVETVINGAVVLVNETAPTTDVAGQGYLYAEGGALKWRSPGGTVTTIAPA